MYGEKIPLRQRIRVMQVVSGLTVGGTERMLVSFLPLLDNAKYSISVCCLKGRDALSDELGEKGIKTVYLNMPKGPAFLIILDSVRAILNLVLLMRKGEIDIVHSYLFRANLLCRIAAKLAGVPVVICSLRGVEVTRKYSLFLEKLTSPLVDMFTTVSNAMREYLIVKGGFNPARIKTVYNGVDVSHLEIGPVRREELGLPSNVVMVATVARLIKVKGHEYLLRAIKIITKEYSRVHFLVVGDGPQRERLVRLASNLGVERYVTFTGERKDVARILATSDIFILPTLWEGLSMAVLEAMAMAKPVVTTKVGGNSELVIDGVTGFLVPPKDVDGLARKTLRLLKDENLRRRMGNAARKRVEERFDMEAMVKEIENVYQELLNRKKGYQITIKQ